MNEEHEKMRIYGAAVEKLCSMIDTIEQTMLFMEDYKVRPDNVAVEVLSPFIEKLQKWIETK